MSRRTTTLATFNCGTKKYTCFIDYDFISYLKLNRVMYELDKNCEVEENIFAMIMLKYPRASNDEILLHLVQNAVTQEIDKEIKSLIMGEEELAKAPNELIDSLHKRYYD